MSNFGLWVSPNGFEAELISGAIADKQCISFDVPAMVVVAAAADFGGCMLTLV